MSPHIKAVIVCVIIAICAPALVAFICWVTLPTWLPGTVFAGVMMVMQIPSTYAQMYVHYVMQDLKKFDLSKPT